MHVDRVGSGPGIVLIHGAFSDGRVWEPQVELADNHTLHVLTLTGYHPDREVPAEVTAASQADEVLAFLAQIDGPVALVGHSRGGRLAMEIATRAAQRIEKLVLIEPGGVAEAGFYDGIARAPSPSDDPRAEVAKLVAQGHRAQALELYIDHGHGVGTWSGLPRWFQEMASENAHTIDMMIRDGTVPMSRTSMAGLRCPTLLLLGSRSPAIFSETAAVLTRVMDSLRIVDIAADHFMTLKEPGTCNREIRSWLASPGVSS